jgi:sulfatase modifying factor 1
MKLGLGALALGGWVAAFGQAPVISSFSHNGELVCTNLPPGTVATVEWASSVTGPWTNNWAGLDAVLADSNGIIQVRVPMFYRVRAITNFAAGQMVLIPEGSFTMGNCMDTNEGYADELPLHTVYVSAFYMDLYEVTKALWDEVKAWNGGNGYNFEDADSGQGKAANHPAHTMTWYDAVKWCNARSERDNLTPCYYADSALTIIYKTDHVEPYVKWDANGYRLPTEAEWEKAARGGSSGHRFPWSDSDTIQHSRANYNAEGPASYDLNYPAGYHPTYATGGIPYTSPVGSFAANGYGLYDMAGNVWEWCYDWLGAYSSESQTDPRGPTSGSIRVGRGTSWAGQAIFCRVAYRGKNGPGGRSYDIGFRCARAASQ